MKYQDVVYLSKVKFVSCSRGDATQTYSKMRRTGLKIPEKNIAAAEIFSGQVYEVYMLYEVQSLGDLEIIVLRDSS